MLRILWEANPSETAALVAVAVVSSVLLAICMIALVGSYLD